MAQSLHRGTRGERLFCWLFVIVGLVLVGNGIRLVTHGLRAEHWPVTVGTVQSGGIKSISDEDGTTYSAEVTYLYEVAGTKYTNDEAAMEGMSASQSYAEGVLKQYPVGKKICVYYSPGNPAEAVLEPGIHGGAWICLALGAAFTLFGILFRQIARAAVRPASPTPLSRGLARQTDGSVSTDQPPVLLGVIFLLAGIGLGFVPPESGQPRWLMYAVGAVFFCGGVVALLYRLKDKTYSKLASFVFLVPFLAIFHWVSFGLGDRTGTFSTSFSVSQPVNDRTPFALFTVLIDAGIVAGLIHWLLKGRKR